VVTALGQQGEVAVLHVRHRAQRSAALQQDLGRRPQVDHLPQCQVLHEPADVVLAERLQVVAAQDPAGQGGAAVGRGEAAEVTGVGGAVEPQPAVGAGGTHPSTVRRRHDDHPG
jgi:hypothetical protein